MDLALEDAEEAGARFERTAHGTPVLQEALAYLECRLHSAQDAGDHTIFIAEVEDVVVREGDPLTYFRGKYRHVGDHVESNEPATTIEGSDFTRASRAAKR